MVINVTTLTGRRADNRWDRVCVGDITERVALSTPDREAIVGWAGAFSEPRFERLTFSQADKLANQVANGLIAHGLSQGDRVALVCENSVEGYVFKLGASKAGLVVVPLNPSMAPDVMAHILGRIEPKFTVVDAELWPAAEKAFATAGLSPDVTIEIGGSAVEQSIGYGGFVSGRDVEEPKVTIHGDDIWEILYTSGTTAMPKGAMISHTSSTLAAHGFAPALTRGIPFESDLSVGVFLPMMYHIGHNIFALGAFASGGSLVIGRSPNPAAVAAAIEREHLTALWGGSPAMFQGLLGAVEADRRDISSLTVAAYGWGALPPTLLDRLKLHAPRLSVVGIFGQTESISCHRFWPDQWEALYRATAPQDNYVGFPSPLLGSRIVDADGNSLAGQQQVAGEAVYRSSVITAGYYKDEEATRDAFRDGWFHSGDSCYYDERGLRVMVDRYKDIVKTGGENVSTIRVESVLALHPGVAKAAVIGVNHERWGQAVTAVVVPSAPGAVSSADLIAFVRERLSGFETPKTVIFVDELPETVGGKIMKFKLREQYR